jgi:hypothetical protein
MGTSVGLTRVTGPYGTALGGALTAAAINGDVRSAIESGVYDAQAIANAIAGGEIENSFGNDCECQ